MKVLLSVKPEYAEKILSGEKRYEFRKSMFKNPLVKTVVIYSTMPIGKVVGEFDFDAVLSDAPDRIWKQTSTRSGISRKYFNEYFMGRSTAYAIRISEVRKYERPKSLGEIVPSGQAPQSFCYLSAPPEQKIAVS